MAFVLTLLYIATTLLSPGVFPQAIAALHINIILGILVILTSVPMLPESKLGSLPDNFLAFGLIAATVTSMMATGWIGGALDTFLDFFPIWITFYFVAITCNSLVRI